MLDALEVYLAAPDAKLPVEDVWIGLISLAEHHDGPDAPVEVVKNHALLSVQNSFLAFLSFHGPLEDPVVLSLRLQAHILLSHRFNLGIRWEVAHVVSYAIAQRVRIVTHHFVQVAAKVIGLRVPHAILIVDQHKACRVL